MTGLLLELGSTHCWGQCKLFIKGFLRSSLLSEWLYDTMSIQLLVFGNIFSVLRIVPQVSLVYRVHASVVLWHYVPLSCHPHNYDIKCTKWQLITLHIYLAFHFFSSWYIWWPLVLSVFIGIYFDIYSLSCTSPLIRLFGIVSEI